ncbi:Elongation factor-like GTPase 1 [Geodia barretti]|nr:Elongation factor-like GTPase 1 [Geodia barretti]
MEAAANSKDIGSRADTQGDKEEEVMYDWSDGLDETDDSALYFSPEAGNVVFASALDGWGFGVSHFAELYSKKLGIRQEVLQRTLWGNFYLNSKAKRIFRGATAKAKKPLFVQFVLDNIWAVYDAVVLQRDKTKIEKIVGSLGLKIPARDSRHTDPRVHLAAICSQWLPLAPAVLAMATSHLPSPLQLEPSRVERLMCSTAQSFDSFPVQTQQLSRDFLVCSSSEDAPTIGFVSKLFCVDHSMLPQNQSRPLTMEEIAKRRAAVKQRLKDQENLSSTEKSQKEGEEDGEKREEEEERSVFLAFARIYSGTLRRGQEVYVLQPRYDPQEMDLDNPRLCQDDPAGSSSLGHVGPGNANGVGADGGGGAERYATKVKITELYILMGRGVVQVESVPAGNVLGIGGLDQHILKSATVSTSLACPAFRPMSFAAAPILRVAVEPNNASDTAALSRGMSLLNQADASVEISLQATGEYILSTAGEVHLQRCLDDLRDTFAKVTLSVSAPIVPFRETIIPPPKLDTLNEVISEENVVKLAPVNPLLSEGERAEGEIVTVQTPNKACTLLIQAKPLPERVVGLLSSSTALLKALYLTTSSSGGKGQVLLSSETLEKLKKLRRDLEEGFSSEESWSEFSDDFLGRIWGFGPKSTGTNVLLCGLSEYRRGSVWRGVEGGREGPQGYHHSVVYGFQLACQAGPLCEEPLRGVCFVLRGWNFAASEGGETTGDKSLSEDTTPPVVKTVAGSYGPFSGQLISTVKEGCRRAFQVQPARLMSAMYTCNILATAEVLGKLYAVLGRRNGRVCAEEMREGSTVFSIQALVPVAESFGFAEEVRKKTSGLASPQLFFSHWEVIPNDPFWVPSSEEELLHFGEKADSENLARRYMNAVRKRKGLAVDEKLVEHGEKQRTLKRKQIAQLLCTNHVSFLCHHLVYMSSRILPFLARIC